ncbi:MAG: Gfo/Idh/MocA family oxidoreductase [Planctomycetota bacterium]|nr:MAG: Gfo/Idh/MocA family oxidoreductase [Planctomycetota bacterium]
MSGDLSRRTFIERSTVGASALAIGPAGVAGGYPANEKVNLGWIGFGNRAERLFKFMKKHVPGARTAAVCDLKPERIEAGKKLAEDDRPAGYTDFRKMMDSEKLDGILVVTKGHQHAEVVVPVLWAGFHCFSEKPMDTTVGKIDAIVKAARISKGFYQIGIQRRYHPGFVSAMPMIHSGKFGKVTFMQGHWHWGWNTVATKVDGGNWWIVAQACHHTDVMNWAMGDKAPLSSVGMGYHQQNKLPNEYRETHCAVAFKYPGGPIFSYTLLFSLPQKFQDEKLWVFCEKAGFDLPRGMMYGRDKSEKRVGEDSFSKEKGGVDWNKGTIEELQDFVDNIKTGGKRKPKANVETGRISTLTAIMGRMAMIDLARNKYESRIIKWEDLGTTTDL